jgi:hypothetical protein
MRYQCYVRETTVYEVTVDAESRKEAEVLAEVEHLNGNTRFSSIEKRVADATTTESLCGLLPYLCFVMRKDEPKRKNVYEILAVHINEAKRRAAERFLQENPGTARHALAVAATANP